MKIPPPNKSVLVAENTTPQQVAVIMASLVTRLASHDDVTRFLAEKYSREPFEILAKHIYECVYFEPDPPKTQVIRTPHAVLRDERANCVDYTVILAAVAKALGLPVTIRIVKFSPDKNFSHVYPIIDGVPVDLVIGQDQTGKEYLQRQNKNFDHFGSEVEYFAKFDTLVL